MFKRIEQVPSSSWRSWLSKHDGIMVDVRNPDEWATGTLPGVKRISLDRLPAGVVKLDKTRPTLVICHSGGRSRQAARFLADHGFSKVANLKGGMKAVGTVR